MRAFLECIPCVLNQIIKVLNKNVSSQKRCEKILASVLDELSGLPLSLTPPDLTHEAYNILRRYLGNWDFFAKEKVESNKTALKLYPKLRQKVQKSKKPLNDALLLSISGNIIDYGPDHEFDINKTIKKVLKSKLSNKQFVKFKEKVNRAKQVLYVCDNAGEIVFDRLLIEFIRSKYKSKITVAVKSKPVLNDALIADAKVAGLDRIAKVIESGSVTAGTTIEKTSKAFQKLYKNADLVIAKGQGNFETLPHNSKTFFLLMVKCPHLALATKLKYGEIVLWSKD